MRLFSEDLKVERIKIKIANLPSELSGLKVIQLSDLHYDGECLSDELLLKAIEISNNEKPDIVALTGDFITHKLSAILGLIPYLKSLKSKQKIYACLGNHDVYFSRNAKRIVTQNLTSVGIKVLWNQIDYLYNNKLAIVGLADFWSSDFNPQPVFAQLPPHIPRLVLAHNPDTMEDLQEFTVDLQLSGHTHGGQLVIPLIGPLPMIIMKIRQATPRFLHRLIPYVNVCKNIMKHWEWSEGYHKVGKNQLYVNRGLGTYPPGRLFCPPELTVITITKF